MRILILLVICLDVYGQHISAEELKPLEFMVGTWRVESDVRLSKNGPWEQSVGQALITRTVGETILEESYTGTRQGSVFTSKTWLGNDNRTKLYQKVFVDSGHGVLVLYEGTLEEKILNLYHKLHLNDVTITLRSKYDLISDDSYTVESARSLNDGKTWDMTGRLKYERIK